MIVRIRPYTQTNEGRGFVDIADSEEAVARVISRLLSKPEVMMLTLSLVDEHGMTLRPTHALAAT